MILNPGYFKSLARKMLKGDWQTAMLVTFFSGVFITLLSLQIQLIANIVTEAAIPAVTAAYNSLRDGLPAQAEANLLVMAQRAAEAIRGIPASRWTLLAATAVLGALMTPALLIGEKAYYLDRQEGDEPSVWQGLFGAFSRFGGAWALYALLALKLLAWSLIEVPVVFLLARTGLQTTAVGAMLCLAGYVPAVIALLKNMLAPWFFAENPSMSPRDAMRRSRETVKGRAGGLLLLVTSFLFWIFVRMAAESILSGMGLPLWLVTVFSLFAELLINVYFIATVCCFYSVVSDDGRMAEMTRDILRMMREAGMDPPSGMDGAEDSEIPADAENPDEEPDGDPDDDGPDDE